MSDSSGGRRTALGLVSATLGLALLLYLVRRVGWDEVAAGLRQVGWGFAPIVAIAGLRFLARAVGWTLCVERPHELPLGEAFVATVSGDTLGNLTPFGPLVGEPAKAALVGGRLPLAAALSALAVENFLYALSVAVMIAAGLGALLFAFDLPGAVRQVALLALAALLAAIGAALWLAATRPAIVSAGLDWTLGRTRLPGLQGRLDRIRSIERRLYGAYERSRGRLAPVVGAQVLFHALGVTEVYVTLWLITGAPPPLLVSFVLETANRLIVAAFKFVPLRVGVDEAGSGWLADALGVGGSVGVTLALVRKVRILAWSAAGAAFLARRGAGLPTQVSKTRQ
jgi:hypothetical protein